MSKNYTMDDLKPILSGDAPLPNFEPQPPPLVLNNIAAVGHHLRPIWGYAKMPDGSKDWAYFFLSPAGMGSAMSTPPSLDGGGYVMIYTPSHLPPRVGRFAICKHKFKMSAGANPSRGWRPGACETCGMDMSVDSGD